MPVASGFVFSNPPNAPGQGRLNGRTGLFLQKTVRDRGIGFVPQRMPAPPLGSYFQACGTTPRLVTPRSDWVRFCKNRRRLPDRNLCAVRRTIYWVRIFKLAWHPGQRHQKGVGFFLQAAGVPAVSLTPCPSCASLGSYSQTDSKSAAMRTPTSGWVRFSPASTSKRIGFVAQNGHHSELARSAGYLYFVPSAGVGPRRRPR